MTHNTDKTFLGYDARQIADWFINHTNENGKTLSIMKMLKLIYISHGWRLSLYNGAPLYRNGTEAWKFGPVVPEVYRTFKNQGMYVTIPSNIEIESSISSQVNDLLTEIYNIYGNYGARYLSDLTHVKGGPWDIARRTGGWYAPITNDSIKQHYDQKRIEARRMESARQELLRTKSNGVESVDY